MIGVWYLIVSFNWATAMIEEMLFDLFLTGNTTFAEYVAAIVMNLVIGLYCLLGAPHLVGMAYGHHLARKTAPESDATDDSE